MKRPIILGSSLAKVPHRPSPLGQHLQLLFVFLQYIFVLLVCLAVMVWDLSPGNKCCSRYFVHAVSTVEHSQSLSDVQWQRFSSLKKSCKLILLMMIFSGPKLCRKLEFQFRVLMIPLSCLWKTQISLQIFESPLSRHAECHRPILEPSMLIFEVGGHVPSSLAVISIWSLVDIAN